MSVEYIYTQEILERISRHCPEALSAYFHCLNRKNQGKTIHFTKKLVEQDMSEDFRVFRNNIKKLARENLLEWHPGEDGIFVTLVSDD